MNRKLKQIINKHSYRLGLEHYEIIRADLIKRAKMLERSGESEAAIIKALGLPLQELNKTPQEAAKCHS